MSVALDELGAGLPIAPFDKVETEAESWAGLASPNELQAYLMATLQQLDGRPLGLTARKRLILALWETFDNRDKVAFINRVTGEVQQ